MICEARTFDRWRSGEENRFRIGVTTGLAPLPAWKQEADFLFVQVSFSLPELLAWRASIEFAGPVYAGVLVKPPAGSSRKSETAPSSTASISSRSATTAKPHNGLRAFPPPPPMTCVYPKRPAQDAFFAVRSPVVVCP
jgi:hypothetical protein